MSQPRIAEIEKPSKRRFNLETLLRIASAFDVGLEVNFVPISEIVRKDNAFDPNDFSIETFEEELARAEKDEQDVAADALLKEFHQRLWNDFVRSWDKWQRRLFQRPIQPR